MSDVDGSLNEVAGIRLPEIALPVGCHTGWNPRHPDHGAPTLPAIFVGFSRFDGDLASPTEVESRARDWAARLVARRVLLAEDLERVVANCLRVHAAASMAGSATGTA